VLIFDENTKPVIFDSIYTPTNVNYFWVLDLNIMDVTLTPLYALEEITCPAIRLEYNGLKFYLPTIYYILVFSEETSQVDTINISELTNNSFSVFSYGLNETTITKLNIKIIDYQQEYKFIIPLLDKTQLLCHPVTPDRWINISSFDQYKLLVNKVIGDFI